MNYVFTISNYIIYFWIIKEYFQCFFESRKRSGFLSACVWGGLFCVNFFLFDKITAQFLLTFLLQFAAQVFVCHILYYGAFSKKLLLVLIETISIALIEVITYVVLSNLDLPDCSFSLAGSLLSKLAAIAIIKAISQRKKPYIFSKLPVFNCISLIVVPVTSCIVIYLIFKTDVQISPDDTFSPSVFAALLLLFVNICIFMIYEQLSQHVETERNQLLQSQQLKVITEQINESRNSIKRLQKEHHDFKNTIIYIQQLAREEKCDTIAQYVNDYLSVSESISNNINTGNTVMDALINYKCHVASDLGIKVITHFEIPADLPFNNDTLCIILGNVLDNAIEAVEKVSGRRFIDLSVYYKKQCLCMIIKNPYEHRLRYNARQQLLTTKKSADKHGIGLSSMEAAVNKSNGHIFIETKNSIFTVKILLYEESELK